MHEHAPQEGSIEMEHTAEFFTLPLATGSIEAKADQQERLDEFTERLKGDEFYRDAEGVIPAECVDERDGDPRFFPNAVGGTETLMVADDLTTKRFAGSDGSTLAAMRSVAEYVVATGNPVGDHDGDHAHGDLTDCGGIDKMPLGYLCIDKHGDELRRILTDKIGVEVTDDTHERIVAAARERTEFSVPREVLAALREVGGEDSVQHMTSDHRGVVAVLNAKHGTTLDRGALAKEFGTDYEAFNVDVWSLPEAANLISESPDEAYDKTIAAAYFNLAIGHVLWGPNMRVIVRN